VVAILQVELMKPQHMKLKEDDGFVISSHLTEYMLQEMIEKVFEGH
jgi:hypothetical protein